MADRAMRIGGVQVFEPMGGYEGDWFLIKVCPERGDDHYILSHEPGRTNQSHEERTDGWLGTTDNVARYAEGAIRVTVDKVGRRRVSRIDAEKLIAEANVEIEENEENEENEPASQATRPAPA